MDENECLVLDPKDQPSSSTQSTNLSISMSMSANISMEKYTKESIMLGLKYKKNEYAIVDKNSTANCWSTFGLPAKILGTDKYEIIPKFASCKSCFQTYSYSSSTSTLTHHKCSMLSNNNQPKIQLIPVSKSSTSTKTGDITNPAHSANTKILEKHKRSVTSVISDWICSDTRPINIVEDTGLKNLIEECVKIGFVCGPVSASSILSCRKTISKEIKQTANNRRNKIQDILINVARERRLALSPDLWSDGYKKTSYLGCTAHWVHNWKLYSFELFCLPYRQPNKKDSSVLKALEEGLSLYELIPFMFDIVWVCDGGSNLLKALEKFIVVRCVAHRLNNCLQTIFFQTETMKLKKHTLFPDYFHEKSEDEDDQISGSDNEQSDDVINDDQVNNKQKTNSKSSRSNRNNIISVIAQLPYEAKRILITIIECKELVTYIKKINLNQDLEDRNAVALLQCTIVRWLSLLNCLQSVNRSLTPLHEIFEEKNLNTNRINKISVSLLEKLIDFLKPWEYVMKRIQSAKVPSIHTVTPSIFMINSSLEIKSNDSKQDKGFTFFRERAKQTIKEKIEFHPIHLMATFLNPKTRKMKHLSVRQREECIEYVKQEMLLFDVDDCIKPSTPRKESRLPKNPSISYMTDFYSNVEDDVDKSTALRSSSHALEIELYIKQGSDKTIQRVDSFDEEEKEYNPLSFWKKMHSSYPVLSKVAARIFAVPASSAAVERQFSLAGNIITQKRSRLSPETVNDMVFNHSYKIYQQEFDQTDGG